MKENKLKAALREMAVIDAVYLEDELKKVSAHVFTKEFEEKIRDLLRGTTAMQCRIKGISLQRF